MWSSLQRSKHVGTGLDLLKLATLSAFIRITTVEMEKRRTVRIGKDIAMWWFEG